MKVSTRQKFGAAVASATILLQTQAWSQPQSLAPTATVQSGPATAVHPVENFVMQRPAESQWVPFRSTLGVSAYAAAKQVAGNYSPLALKPGANSPTPAAPPTIITANFNGASDTDGLRPPDTHGAVGHTHFVETTNSHINIWKKLPLPTPTKVKSVSQATFFNYFTQTLFDARVVYDTVWQRWIITTEAFPESDTMQRFFIAVSKTSDPTGGFFIYSLNVAFHFGDFFDFPQVGFDQDAVIITANIFNSSDVFQGADMFAIAKARLYNGLGFSVPLFEGLDGTLAPPIVLDQNADAFLLAARPSGSTLTKYTLTNASNAFQASLGVATFISVPSYTVPPDGRQFGTPIKLDTSDSRFVNNSTQNGNDLWQTHTIALGGFPAPKFYRINTGINTVKQSSFFFKNGSSDDFNASIVANPFGDIFVTWTSTDAGNGVNAQVVFSGKRDADTTIPTGGVVGFTSSTFYSVSGNSPER